MPNTVADIALDQSPEKVNWEPEVRRIAQEEGVDPDQAVSLAQFESSMKPFAVGPKTQFGHAVGLMQIMPSQHPEWTGTIESNIRTGLRVFRKGLDLFNGDPDAAYRKHYNPGFQGAGPFAKPTPAAGPSRVQLTFQEPQKAGDSTRAPSHSLTFVSPTEPQKPVATDLQPPAATPPTHPGWLAGMLTEAPAKIPTWEDIQRDLISGWQQFTGTGPAAQTKGFGAQLSQVGLGALQLAGEPFSVAHRWLKGEILYQHPGDTYAGALERNFHLSPNVAHVAGVVSDYIADPTVLLGSGPVLRSLGALRKVMGIDKVAPVESRAASVADYLTPKPGTLEDRGKTIADTLLNDNRHPTVPLMPPKEDIPITTAHAHPASPVVQGPHPFENLGQAVPDPLARVTLAAERPGEMLRAMIAPSEEAARQFLAVRGPARGPAELAFREALLGEPLGLGEIRFPAEPSAFPPQVRGRAETLEDQAIMQSMERQRLRDERLLQFREQGREYKGPLTGDPNLPPIAGASVDELHPSMAHAVFQGIYTLGNKVMQYGRQVKGVLAETVRGLAIASSNAMKTISPELHGLVHAAREDAELRYGQVNYAINKLTKGITDADWGAIQPHIDAELKATQTTLFDPTSSDIAKLGTLTTEQQAVKNAIMNYYNTTTRDLMRVTGWDYAKAQAKLIEFMREGTTDAVPRFSSKVEFLTAAEKAERHLAFTERLGRNGERAQAILDDLKAREGLPEGVANRVRPGTHAFADTWYKMMTGASYTSDAVSARIVNSITSLTVAAKLPLAVLRHAGQMINAAAIADIGSVTRGLVKLANLAHSQGDMEFIDKLGIINKETLNQWRRLETGTPEETWGSHVLEKTQLYKMRQVNIRGSGLIGREAFNSAVKRVDLAQNEALLRRMGFNEEDLARFRGGNWTEADQIKAGRWMAITTQFGGSFGDLPLLVQTSPWVRLGFLLKGFHFKQTSLLRDALWTHGLQDVIKTGRITSSNIRPFLAFAGLAYPVGEVLRDTQVAATYVMGGALGKDNIYDYWQKRRPPEKLARWIDNIAYVGSLGMLDQVRLALQHPTRDPSRAAGEIAPTLGDVVGVTQDMHQFLREIADGYFPSHSITDLAARAAGYTKYLGIELPTAIRGQLPELLDRLGLWH